MLPKTAVVKGFVDQMELVNVTPVFTWRIAQVSFRYVILFCILFWPTLRAIVIKKNFCEFEAEGQESIHKTNSFKQRKVRIIYLLHGAKFKNACCEKSKFR